MPPGPGGPSPEEKLERAPGARVVDAAEELMFLGREGRLHALSGESAELARAVLEELATSRTRAELYAALEARAEAPIEPGGAVGALLTLLLDHGVLHATAGVARPRAPRPAGKRVVLGLTGAIGTAEAPSLVSALLARGHTVRIAMTRAASRLVRAEPLEALTHAPVVRSLWSRDPARPVPHLDLAAWADAVLVCPASATTISRLARGDFSDVVAATALAARAKVLLAPSMNPAMMAAPAVRRNLEQLREDGFLLVMPGSGHEVAEAPARRRPLAASAPHHKAVLDLLDAVLSVEARGARAGEEPSLPRDAGAWEALYTAQAGPPPWQGEGADQDMLAAVDAMSPAPRLALDIGTGTGATAAALAAREHAVVAIDVAPSALAAARARHAGARVVWLACDVTSPSLAGDFDVALDRGCLHSLSTGLHAGYAEAVARLVRPGGALILKVDSAEAPASRASHRFDEARLVALLGRDFDLLRAERSRLYAADPAGSAWLAVLRRKPHESSIFRPRTVLDALAQDLEY